MDGILNQETTYTVDTAILLTTSGVLAASPGAGEERIPGPLTPVGGMTLFQRAVMTLQRGGISQIWVLVGQEEAALRKLLKKDTRIQAAVRWLPVREFPPHDPQTWETLADEVEGACMVVGCHTVYSPSLVHRLRDEGAQGKAVVVVGHAQEGHFWGNPGVVVRPDSCDGQTAPTVVFQDSEKFDDHSERTSSKNELTKARPLVGDLLVLPARLLGVSGILNANGTNPLRLALEQAAVEGAVQTVKGPSHWFRDVRGPKGPQMAERTLVQSLQTLKGGLDGFVDRHVNRKCSGYLTRLFLRLGWSPNSITFLSMGVGLLAAAFFLPGVWKFAILGALLFQVSAIIDCCDGEVARLTFSESKFGQELDIWADNVVHMAIFAAMAGGAYLQGPWENSFLPLLLGASAVLANLVSLLLVNHARHLRSHQKGFQRLAESERRMVTSLLSRVANRDFSILVLICAVFGVLHWFLALAAIGSWIFVVTMGWVLRRSLLPRA